MTLPALSPDSSVAAWFERQAEMTPDAAAVVAGNTTTYRELLHDVLQVDSFLRARGIEPEELVAVFMTRSARMIAVMLGILRAGGAYVPLDPADPPERNCRILLQSGASLVLASRACFDAGRTALTGGGPGTFEFIDAEQAAGIPGEAAPPPPAPGGARLAYVLFTSGSTGEPKGVAVEHCSILNLLCAARDLIGFTHSDRILAASTIGFDISIAELFLPLITGGSLLLRDRSIWLDPRQLAEDVRRHGVTVMQTGPSTWSVILAGMPDFPQLRVVISTAEAIPPELARRLARCGEQAWNLYGPTEATVWATAHRLSPDEVPSREGAISALIGRPIAGTQVLVLGEGGHPVSNGEVGELCLGGPCLARGYYRDKSLTRERFFPWGPAGERYYRTGDLVAKRADGALEYFGRNDDQLKIRGVRLEPREVESVISRHPAVARVAATWFTSPDGSRSLMAAIVPRPDAELAGSVLHHWLEPRLLPQMIPSRFVVCETLPLSPAGKVDRAAIRLLAAVESAKPQERPFTLTEAVLADIWRRLLKIESAAPGDHFFSIGGDSLAAVRMVIEAESVFRVDLPVAMVFESPTIGQLAARIDKLLGKGGGESNPRFVFPLSLSSPGHPLFFNWVDLKLASRNRWRAPCPLYSVSHWALGSGFLDAGSVEELARRQIIGIRAIQSAGPYRIAGYHFGGLVAVEIARQLQDAGEDVEFLFLLDPLQPHRSKGAPKHDRGEGQDRKAGEADCEGAERRLQEPVAHPGGGSRLLIGKVRSFWNSHISRALTGLSSWIAYQIVHLHGRRPNPMSSWLLPKNRWPAFWRSARRLSRVHTAKPYQGRVLAVFPAGSKSVRVWQKLLDAGTETHVISAPPSSLFDEPAVSQWMPLLARFMGETTRSQPAVPQRDEGKFAMGAAGSFLVPLQTGGGRAPIFLVPGGWGGDAEILVLGRIAANLKLERPVFGVRSRAMELEWRQPATIAEHAIAVLAAMRNLQPLGSGLIIGECIAGALAMELANLAGQAGSPPEAVILLDPWMPSHAAIGSACPQPSRSSFAGAAAGQGAFANLPSRVEEYYRMLDTWRPTAIRSTLHLIVSAGVADRDLTVRYWEQFAGNGFHVHSVPGNHHTFIRENAEATARVLDSILR